MKETQRFSLWMGFFTFCIFVLVGIGGLTRLTGSGLSMVTWKPFTGVWPPFFETDWVLLFQEYQTSPEFRKMNFAFSLSDFKSIFWLEYIHRLWGRLLGVILLIPTYYAFRYHPLHPALPGVFLLWILGLLQGGLGWYMVKSGLIDNPWVSPYRLAAHLFLGLLLFGLSLKLTLIFQERRKGSLFLLLLLSITIVWGGLVAGLKAGLIYNTFPLMEGLWIPENPFVLRPFMLNFFENPATVQWTHRLLATLTLGCTLFLAWRGYIASRSPLFLGWTAMAVLQVTLGAITALYAVPVFWGICHQLWAFMLWGLIVVGIKEKKTA